MAKAKTTTSDKNGRKPEEKKPVGTKPESKPAPGKSAVAGSSSPAVTTSSSSVERAPRPAAGPPPRSVDAPAQAIPEATQVRSHPDAKLTKGEIQILYQKLVDERNRVLSGFDRHVSEALEDGDVLADEIDIAQRSTDQAWLFKFADKERKLLIEIEQALVKMRGGEYGLCEGTDEPIGYKRLELRPWTRYSVGYKELLEREKAQHTR